jgi:hypothetical protein
MGPEPRRRIDLRSWRRGIWAVASNTAAVP